MEPIGKIVDIFRKIKSLEKNSRIFEAENGKISQKFCRKKVTKEDRLNADKGTFFVIEIR